DPFLRVFSRRQWSRSWCQPSNRMDGTCRKIDPAVWGMNTSNVVREANRVNDKIQRIVIRKEDCQNLNRALSLEWLETNGRGGFASGTVAGANTRRYHALLLTARTPPNDRYVLVNHVEEWVLIDGEQFSLSTNLYPGVVHPQGYTRCTSFTSTPWP